MYLFIANDPSSQEREVACSESVKPEQLFKVKMVSLFYSLFAWLCFKQAFVHKAVMDELKRIIEDSEVCPFKFVFLFALLR